MKRRRAMAVACTALAAAIVPQLGAGRERPAPGWQAIASDADRQRLRTWRDAWLIGLREAREGGAAAQVSTAGALLDPDAALANLALPDGGYRCRTFKLGAPTAQRRPYAAGLLQPCRIAEGRFAMLGGMQRPAGQLLPYDGARLVFLGAMALGDETRTLDYGRDTVRDMIGLVERIGPQRWRLVLPQPRWESRIDIIEIVPASTQAVSAPRRRAARSDRARG